MDEENEKEIQLNVSIIEMPNNPTPIDVGEAMLLIEQHKSDNASESNSASSHSGETDLADEEDYITKNKQEIWHDLRNDDGNVAIRELMRLTGYSPNTCRDIYENRSILLEQTDDISFVKEIIAIAKRKLDYEQKPSPNVKDSKELDK
ncbi:uncharacterized protein LOC129580005 [Sitodiplosis mosellana]|uniref:uncharacterized protein LOC129579779 n=1 Tax=Sitodiplosis mosellana TaxID=263140 RepID=UPI002444C0CF|nr:uncharacterized protein LOC129579779 [Sitodiplosis mosellana]XP_055326171.1 uncharacterized protein LOC129580005 [Sitodiplosis mosellana]